MKKRCRTSPTSSSLHNHDDDEGRRPRIGRSAPQNSAKQRTKQLSRGSVIDENVIDVSGKSKETAKSVKTEQIHTSGHFEEDLEKVMADVLGYSRNPEVAKDTQNSKKQSKERKA
jgi:hypothetical protein